MQKDRPDIEDLSKRLINGERRALARAITLVESDRADHRLDAEMLLQNVAKTGREALRIGLSGTPGVGKSTFIEALGMHLIGEGKRVAVLAVDPSSQRSGGSILGDKTRMERLGREQAAYIRPSPARTQLGGVARRTREAVALCEAAGFDVVIIETVGVGQSEVTVADLSDLFVLLLAPAGGDELQGVKRGIMEIADIILVNKADGELEATAKRTQADYQGALGLMRKRPEDPDGVPLAMCVSALTGKGLDEFVAKMQELIAWRQSHGHWANRRSAQRRGWFEDELRQGLLAALENPEVRQEIERLGKSVSKGAQSPGAAASNLLKQIGVSTPDR